MSAGDELFVKTGPESALSMFEAEAEGLRELAAADVIRVPYVHDCGVRHGEAYIEIEKLRFVSAGRNDERLLGQQLCTE